MNFIRNIELMVGPGKGAAFELEKLVLESLDSPEFADNSVDEIIAILSTVKVEKKPIRFFSDGSRKGLKIDFNIVKTILSAPNASQVMIYNLNLGSRQAIAKEQENVTLNVGYEGNDLAKLSSGGIISAISEKEGADIKTTILYYDGYAGIIRGVSQKAFGPGVKISAIVLDLAKKLTGVTVSPARIKVTGAVGSRGMITNGRVSDELNRLAEQHGFSWSVQDGVFQALEDGKAFGRVIEVSSKKRNLFNAAAIIEGPAQIQTGVEITAFLDANVLPGDKVNLISDINPDLNGVYKIHNISFTGSTFDNVWEMKIQSFRQF